MNRGKRAFSARETWHTHIFSPAMAALALFLFVSSALISCSFRKEPQITVRAQNRFEKTLRAVTDRDYEPFSYIAGDGSYAGYDVELIAEVANRLQMNLDFVLLDWTDANEYFEDGKADVFLNKETDSVVASRDMIATIPTIEKQYVVYGRQEVSSVADLYGRKIASLHRLSELGLDADITYIDSYAEIFSALARGDFDFAICPIQVGNVFLQKMNLADIKPSYAVSHIYGAMALSPENAELRDNINTVLADLWREGFIENLDQKWISHRYQNVTLRELLAENPWVLAAFALLVVILAALTIGFAFQRRAAAEREAYTKRLKENLDTINQQQAELIEAKDKAEASSRAKTIFLSNMSHDIRTPMNAILGYTALAQKPGASLADIRGFLEKIDSSGKHLLALINDVLEMSRIESGKMDLEETPCDLRRVIEEARDIFSAQMAAKHIRYTVSAERIQNPIVLCDKNRVNRVLLNLISNAFKFTDEGGEVSVTLTQKSAIEAKNPVVEPVETTTRADISTNSMPAIAEYELRVKDTGIGMSAEFAEKVFDAFERERTSTVSGIQGTGLGMAITKSILDLMGGTIRVNSEQGKGTEFVINIHFRVTEDENALGIGAPREARSEATAGSVGMERESAEVRKARPPLAAGTPIYIEEKEKSTASTAPDFSKMRLLLVDDVDVNREIAAMLLGELGFSVETAVNGKEAVEKMVLSEAGHFDSVLMDIQMPVMDGYEATREIRSLADKAKAGVPIVAMTANAFAEDVQKAREAGMNAHVAKPIDIAVLTKTLTELLS